MVPMKELLMFAGAALLMVLTPGPNMVYLVSRSICQGRKAGVVSLFGVIAGFLVHMFAAAIYLLYLAWQAVRPGARSPFEARDLSVDSPPKLMLMGFLTNVLNPK